MKSSDKKQRPGVKELSFAERHHLVAVCRYEPAYLLPVGMGVDVAAKVHQPPANPRRPADKAGVVPVKPNMPWANQ